MLSKYMSLSQKSILARALRASMEYFVDFEKCEEEEMSEEGGAVDQM